MRVIFVGVVALHGLIHLMGFLKAYGLAALPQLTQPISRPLGLLWLAATVLTVSAAAAVLVWPRGWWLLGAAAVVLSQLAIASAWADARFGTLANLLLLLGVAYGAATQGPTSFRAAFEREARAGLARPGRSSVVTEADLAPLPEPVGRYLRATGVVGRPRLQGYRLRFRGRIRSGPEARWMPFEAEQQSFVDQPTRLFLMHATYLGVPIEAFHRLVDGHATMRVRAIGVVPVVDASGPEMDRSEAVTLLNDMAILAPAALLEPSVAWEPVDGRTARARFTLGAATVAATLTFDEEGLLRGFVSEDRSRATPDGKSFTQAGFSTPIQRYGRFGPFRITDRAEARWRMPGGEFTYGEFEVLELAYDGGPGAPAGRP